MVRFESNLGSGLCRYNPDTGRVSTIYFDERPAGAFYVNCREPNLYRQEDESVRCSGFVSELTVTLEDGTVVVVPTTPIDEDSDGGERGVFVYWTEVFPANAHEFDIIDEVEEVTDVERLPGYDEQYVVARDKFRVLRHRTTGQVVRIKVEDHLAEK